eukprot:754803-Hanusia_phi.AAC.1
MALFSSWSLRRVVISPTSGAIDNSLLSIMDNSLSLVSLHTEAGTSRSRLSLRLHSVRECNVEMESGMRKSRLPVMLREVSWGRLTMEVGINTSCMTDTSSDPPCHEADAVRERRDSVVADIQDSQHAEKTDCLGDLLDVVVAEGKAGDLLSRLQDLDGELEQTSPAQIDASVDEAVLDRAEIGHELLNVFVEVHLYHLAQIVVESKVDHDKPDHVCDLAGDHGEFVGRHSQDLQALENTNVWNDLAKSVFIQMEGVQLAAESQLNRDFFQLVVSQVQRSERCEQLDMLREKFQSIRRQIQAVDVRELCNQVKQQKKTKK